MNDEYQLPDELPLLPNGAVGGVWDLDSQEWAEPLYTNDDLMDAIDGLSRSAYRLKNGHTATVIDLNGEEVEPSGF